VTQGNFFKHSLPWFNVTCWPENKWCQTNRWLGLHETSFLPCQSASTTPWDQVFRVSPGNLDSLCTTVRSSGPVLLSEIQAQRAQRIVDPPNHWACFLTLAMKNGIPQSWRAQVTHVLLLSLPHFPRPHLTEKSSTQDRGTFLQLLPAWLAGLP
jgi:hypothetical protein